MECPGCGLENTSVAVRCAECNRPLDSSDRLPGVAVRFSGSAIAAAACAFVAWVCCVPSIIAELDPFFLDPQSGLVKLTSLVTLLATALGFLLGIVGLVEVAGSGGRRTGYGFAAIGATAPAVLILVLVYIPTFGGAPALAPRLTCGANLSQIGKAMMIYANDNLDRLPVAGGRETIWRAGLKDWTAVTRQEAFGLDPSGAGGQATISSSLYLLVKYRQVSPQLFVCKGDRQTRPFKPGKYRVDEERLTDLWDFGPDPARHCSYAYHIPYGRYALTLASDPRLAVAADRNPWINGPRQKAADFSLFKPDARPFNGTTEEVRRGNVRAHRYDGQNIMFLDSHVEFAERPYRAFRNDNVYTSWEGDDRARGIAPKPYQSQPAGELDSLLVNDPPLGR